MTSTGPLTHSPPADGAVRASEALRSSRHLAHRLGRRARYLAAVAATPGLRGSPIALGPRVSLGFGPRGSFTRGDRCTIAGDFTGQFEGSVVWGDDVFVNVGAYMSVFESLHVGHRVRFGERVSVHDEDHDFEPVGVDREGYRTAPVVIGDDVWLGAGAIVLRGSTIGAGSVVAAGAVVKGRFGPGQLIAGVPARVVRPLRTSEDPVTTLDARGT